VKRGFNRLFLALTLLWAIFWAVLYPLHRQWEGQQKAFEEYSKMQKTCAQLVLELPEWDMTKNCYERSFENYQETLKFYSFKNFWIYPVAFWEIFLPIIVVPPIVIYGLAALVVWVRNGFKPRTKEESAEPSKAEPTHPAAPPLVEHVKINCDDILHRRLENDSRFLKLYWSMQRTFGSRSYGREVCLHEAAHAELMEQDGIQNVRFIGPDIIYDPASDKFIASSARAIGDDQPQAVVNEEFIFMIVCHMAAGGVALRLAGILETGEDGDFEHFKRKYAANPPKSGEKPEALWKRAQEAVAARLNEPQTKQRVQAKAEEYFRLLYPSG
jgi:hypothetical protein